jgi:hypothetical protein
MLKCFTYPEDSDMEKCREHVMAIIGKALRNFRYKILGKLRTTHYYYLLHYRQDMVGSLLKGMPKVVDYRQTGAQVMN